MHCLRTALVIAALGIASVPQTARPQQPPAQCQCERCQQLRWEAANTWSMNGFRGRAGGVMSPLAPRTMGLPVGRPYYGHRYFGNYNNRWYGPQYGHF